VSKKEQNRSLEAASDAAYKDLRQLIAKSGHVVSWVVKRPSLKVIRGLVTKPLAERKVQLTIVGPPVVKPTRSSEDETYAFMVSATPRTLVLTDVKELTEHLSRRVITFTATHTVREKGGGHYSVYITRTVYKVALYLDGDLLGTIEKVDEHQSSSGM
jgi:hypothetical protein